VATVSQKKHDCPIKIGKLYKIRHSQKTRIYGNESCGSFIRYAKTDEIFAVLKKESQWSNPDGSTTHDLLVISAMDGCVGCIEVNNFVAPNYWIEIE